jgi:PBP1b-binding outer membrane lipoprotein LpoB
MDYSINALRRFRPALTMFAVCVFLAGCASAPVQEMSDARQAIRAAQDAGASEKAPKQLSEAQMALNRAESQLNKRFFRAARRNAEEAHTKAVEALQTARGQVPDKKE